MSKTKKILLTLLGVFSIILVGVVILLFSFTQSMKADPDEEKKIRVQAERYLEETFDEGTEIYDVLYDNMGNRGYFEYAAKVKHEKYGTKFLVFFNGETGEMEDTFLSDKWQDDAEKEIRPYVEKELGDVLISKEMEDIAESEDWEEIQEEIGDYNQLLLVFDEGIGKELKIDPNKPASYKDYEVSPTIRITLSRKKQDADEDRFTSVINALKKDRILKHGNMIVENISTNGVPLEDDEWHKKF
ncbi:hypothetical protein ACPOM7_22685 [Peribacillus castrilensis]|uniref:Uncharacterized protein n=2 Tax=Peribacillus TaxID=2675229 RepID=A0AAN2TSS6_9BACI|nr:MULTISPECIES: hypothetical protein [Bacillaceae]MBD8590658.1 hypothetical protein [Peribacillus simplex]MCF7622562.1 hypothetical protein [Peribacillus frigoritolerans]MCP1153104.1 hypothetical protein [Peribacillus frigoritolerans]MEA3576965.1 hypothetical protein [Peribacillus frigoritolerans]NCT38286.1 hypothetical protein [Peribacillus frigoritolerans]